ncbi:uncharacterized protein METZ01_LOCUS395146, partial [marine metagenome]
VFKQPVYFISDNHFVSEATPSEKERRNRLYQVFEKIKNTGGTLVIGGDFFDFWFNYKYVIPSGYEDLLDHLDDLNQSGITIHYVLGNHDYWDFGYFKKKFNALVYDQNLEINNGNAKIQVCHGDGLLKNDIGYRFMKKIIRSKLCIFLFRNFHADWGCWLARKISKTSEAYNHNDTKSKSIRKEMIEYAQTQWAAGFTTVLLGHYHQTGIVEENGKHLIFMG